MNPAELRALAERVMKLEGPCRETDADIALALGAIAGRMSDQGATLFIPRYSASLDAAVSLIDALGGPFIAQMGDIAADGLPGVCLCISTDPVKHVWGIGHGADYVGRLARSATAAALLARAAMMESNDDR